MIQQVFNPGFGNGFAVTNSVTATAAVPLPPTCREVALSNESATAWVHVYVTSYEGLAVPTGTAPTLATGFPVAPNSQIRIGVGVGNKVIRTIATAADGILMVNPGNGG